MYDELLEFAVGMARETGKIQLAYFRGDELAVRTKSNVYDVVTRADKESEELIAGMIAERYPDHAILGEDSKVCKNAIVGGAYADGEKKKISVTSKGAVVEANTVLKPGDML